MKPSSHDQILICQNLPACGCKNCPCRRGVRCQCHDYGVLLALALWRTGRNLNRRKNPN